MIYEETRTILEQRLKLVSLSRSRIFSLLDWLTAQQIIRQLCILLGNTPSDCAGYPEMSPRPSQVRKVVTITDVSASYRGEGRD